MSKNVARHIAYGVPPEKILLGMPFFSRGIDPCGNYLEMNGLAGGFFWNYNSD